MTITFTFAINWSGDGVTWIDESANVLSSHLQLGMHDRYEGHEATLESIAAETVVAPKGKLGFSTIVGTLGDSTPSIPNSVPPAGSPSIIAIDAQTVPFGHISSMSQASRGGHGGHSTHVVKKPPKPHHYPHQIGHAPQPAHHKNHSAPDCGPIEYVAEVGTCTITLDNTSRRYSPDNAGSPLYGNLLPRRQMQVRASDPAISFSTVLFTGFLDRIAPDAGIDGARRVTLEGVDALALLNFQKLALPLQQGQTADRIIALAIAATYTPPLMNLMPGAETYDTAADQWSADRTTATDIVRECVESEFGRFFIQRDGTPTYLNRHYLIAPIVAATGVQRLSPVIAIGATDPAAVIVGRDVEQVFNAIDVVTHPRSTLSLIGTVASALSPLLIPPIGAAGPGVRYVTLHFRDASGNPAGATNLQLPLLPTTDFVVNERKDNAGVYYTTPVNGVQYFTIATVAIAGSQITLALSNAALGALYATKFQVRGQLITSYDPITSTTVDPASQVAYQKRPWTHDLPLSADVDFAQSLSTYLIDRYRQPFTRIDGVTIHNEESIAGVSVLGVQLFDQITVSDPQTGLTNMRLWVIGQRIAIAPDGWTVTWITERADDSTYYVVALSALDSGATLAV